MMMDTSAERAVLRRGRNITHLNAREPICRMLIFRHFAETVSAVYAYRRIGAMIMPLLTPVDFTLYV